MSEVSETVELAEDTVIEALESEAVGKKEPGWHKQVAFSTMIMALLAAIGGMLAGISSQEAIDARTKEIVEMNYLEGDRLYMQILKSKHEVLTALGENPDTAEVESLALFAEDLGELGADVTHEESQALAFTNAHVIFAIAVTLLSLGITLGGMAVVVGYRWLWVVGLMIGAVGTAGVIAGVITMVR